MINLNKKKNKKGGFTLVETLVALFIFSISIMTVMAVIAQGIQNTDYAKNKLTAEFLSQEGIEYFRNIRDTFVLYSDNKADGWQKFLIKLKEGGCDKGCLFMPNEKYLDTGNQSFITDITIKPCEDRCTNLFYNSMTGQYAYDSGDNTVFSRTMRVKIIDDNNIAVISDVTFGYGTNNSTISLSEYLSNWME